MNERAIKFVEERMAMHMPHCPVCKGSGMGDSIFSGQPIKIACPCCSDKRKRCEWFASRFFNSEMVLPRYQGAFLSRMKPSGESSLPLERQERVLAALREAPDKGYAFFGPAMAGKSTFSVALYAQMLWQEARTANISDPKYKTSIWRISTKTLLDQHQEWTMRHNFDEDHQPDEPMVTAAKIMRCKDNGSTYRLFLEEIDKIKETEVRRATLFEILNVLHGCEGQLVITSNLTPAQFKERMGDDFNHRVGTLCRVVNFWEDK